MSSKMLFTYILTGFQKYEYFVVKTNYKPRHFKKVLKEGYVSYNDINLQDNKIYDGLMRKDPELVKQQLREYSKYGIVEIDTIKNELFTIRRYTPNPIFQKVIPYMSKYGLEKNYKLLKVISDATLDTKRMRQSLQSVSVDVKITPTGKYLGTYSDYRSSLKLVAGKHSQEPIVEEKPEIIKTTLLVL